VRIDPFEIERYYERWEFAAELMLSSSDCESLSVADLFALEPDAERRLAELRLGYTEVAGSRELRAAAAALYASAGEDDILTVAAAEEGLFLAFQALLAPGDEAIVEVPCYGSPLALARSAGAAVLPWRRRLEDGWRHDLDELAALVGERTRLIYVNSPHNPTGQALDADDYARVVEVARERGIILVCDEVYRGLEHDEAARLDAGVDAYEHAVSLGAVSKAHGLPGLRVAWLASRDGTALAAMRELKLYTTICSSAPAELLLAVALRHDAELVRRSRGFVLAHLPLIDALLARHGDIFSWVRPTAGPIGFPRISGVGDVRGWCEGIAAEHGVLLLPGYVYGMDDHVRLGFGRADTGAAVERLEAALA